MTRKSARLSYFKEYCNSSSIHGLKYFSEDRSAFEKALWAILIISALLGSAFMIYKICDKYEKTPVIVTFATKETSIGDIPFPAITICPETKSKSELFNFTQILEKKKHNQSTSNHENVYFDYMSALCDDYNFKISHSQIETFTTEFFDILDKVKPDFNTIIHNCEFMGKKLDCSEIFTPIITDEGICYSFNILDRSLIFSDQVVFYKDYHEAPKAYNSWSIESGYSAASSFDTYPRRALLSGATNGITMNLATLKQNKDYNCKGVQGYRVLLHTPMRYPRLKQEYFRVSFDQAVITAIQPVMITTSEEVKTYDSTKRLCYFPDEKKLKYFRSYSQLNCQLECLTNYTVKSCGCVNIFMPRDNTSSICGFAKQLCVKTAEDNYHIASFQSDKAQLGTHCDCMPLCTDLSYNMESSQTNWDWEEKFRSLKNLEFDKNKVHLSSLTVYFKFNHFITSERNELYGATDFLANFGGLLGLFTGFSILSLVEIIYFLSVRICCNLKMYNN